MKALCAIAAVLLLGACASQPAEPRIQIKEVQVPIAVKCAADAGPRPAYADTPDALKGAADLFEKVKLLLAGRSQRMAREAELEAANAGCR